MKTNQLFQILVIGGSMLGASASVSAQQQLSAQTQEESLEIPIELAVPDVLAFCERTDPGLCENGKPKQGVECCWGTSCGE